MIEWYNSIEYFSINSRKSWCSSKIKCFDQLLLYDELQVHNQHQYRRQQGNEWFRWGGNASASIAAGSQSGVAASGAPPAGSRWIDPSSYTIPSPPRQGGCSAAHISTIHTLCIKVSYTIVYNLEPTKAGEESTLHNMQTICSEPVWQLMSFHTFCNSVRNISNIIMS